MRANDIAVINCRIVGSFFCVMTEEEKKMNTLLIQKVGGEDVKDFLSDFNIGIKSIPLFIPLEMKELPSRDWEDEDGEDTYFPNSLKYKAYDVEIEAHYKGNKGTFPIMLDSVFTYLTEGGCELNIYSPYSQTGCKGAYFKGFSDFDFHRDNLGEDAGFKMTFRVTKPGETFIIS